MRNLARLLLIPFIHLQISCYSPQPIKHQNEYVATYPKNNYQVIEFKKHDQIYKVGLFLFNEFQKRQHLIDSRYRKGLENPDNVLKIVDLIDTDNNKIISILEIISAFNSKEVERQLDEILLEKEFTKTQSAQQP
ncbi:hypothetical protein HYV49_02560 [Candidatus Pacearchaeota archaeon]|nr:hypothetical protein [Candidatus Pacearchaeota archaeon]